MRNIVPTIPHARIDSGGGSSRLSGFSPAFARAFAASAARSISFGVASTWPSPAFPVGRPGGVPHLPDAVAREAYAQEVSSLGFWPGNAAMPAPIFYSYAYPEPAGFARAAVSPPPARYDPKLHEFTLPYDAVRQADSPDEFLLEFAQSAYDAASTLGKWDRAALQEQKPSLHSAPPHS